ncbi:methylthioribose-1-phosphate isomerase-like [Panonychus citri]|uniref:methylthioribose-1-phosphate isomerase-like n=1 Tax=Panonychus citri TaxID=50023 RepID=UPI0023082561|nr:methylthioribose-1-phosphate isomerase-like [Panonychus citri]
MTNMNSIIYTRDKLKILDQRKLPLIEIYVDINCVEDGFNAIKDMLVRGAPCIAMVGILSIAVELTDPEKLINQGKLSGLTVDGLQRYLNKTCQLLCEARPTAINLRNECEKLRQFVSDMSKNPNVTIENLIGKIGDYSADLLNEDIRVNRSIGKFGADHFIANLMTDDYKLKVLTHCNTGSLATAGYGTALGVIRALHEADKLEMVYFTETRPYNQGARLTAFELVKEKIPCKLICDNMVAALMSTRKIDAVVVGADRVVQNGDTANKIGTYQISVISKHHKVPFFIALPLSTFDPITINGKEIPVEERSQDEVKMINGQFIAPPEVSCWNPSFDITPSEFITGYITENGVFNASELAKHYKSIYTK